MPLREFTERELDHNIRLIGEIFLPEEVLYNGFVRVIEDNRPGFVVSYIGKKSFESSTK